MTKVLGAAVRKIIKSWLKSESFQDKIAAFISLYLRLVYRTSRWEFQGVDRINSVTEQQGWIGCFWHGRMSMIPFMWRWPAKKIVALISAHSDGMMVARTFKRLNIDYVSGSTNRGGVRAFKSLIDVLDRQDVVGIIPDGPRGPAKKLSDGIILLAKHSGQPIVPLAYASSRFVTFNSWDRFQLPLPFSKGVFIYGEPVFIPQECGVEEIEAYRLQVEQAITKLELEADQYIMTKSGK
jgi:lysophospholipid acyltransferase (LPLAT)-like uncharacterized protein